MSELQPVLACTGAPVVAPPPGDAHGGQVMLLGVVQPHSMLWPPSVCFREHLAAVHGAAGLRGLPAAVVQPYSVVVCVVMDTVVVVETWSGCCASDGTIAAAVVGTQQGPSPVGSWPQGGVAPADARSHPAQPASNHQLGAAWQPVLAVATRHGGRGVHQLAPNVAVPWCPWPAAITGGWLCWGGRK
jgi:hypothetical protein